MRRGGRERKIELNKRNKGKPTLKINKEGGKRVTGNREREEAKMAGETA